MNNKRDYYDPTDKDKEQLNLFTYSDRVHSEFSRFDSKSGTFARYTPSYGPRIVSEQKKKDLTAFQTKEYGLVFWK